MTGAFIGNDGVERLVGNEGGLTKNPNDMALMINLITPLTISLFLNSKTMAHRMLLLCAIGCEIATVVMTYSRAGALTIGIIFVLYIWKLRRRQERSWLFAVAVVGILALPMIPSTYYERLSTISSIDSDQTGSSQERWSDMTIALKAFLSNPIKGYGVGMNVNTMREVRGQDGRAVHNVYLEHALDLGLPGLVIFLLLVASCVKAARSAQLQSLLKKNDALFYLAQGIEVSLIAYIVEGMFHPVSYHFYFYYIASLAVAARQIGVSEESYA
jgi:O-antigen ligase